jgi:anti-sigma factor RsiW
MPVDRETNQVRCRDFQELADSYLSDELLVETNHDVIRHLDQCADCRRELAARRNLRNKLRSGFEGTPDLRMPKEFAARLTTQLRDAALSRSRIPVAKYVAIAASLVIVAGLVLMVVQQRRRSQMTASLVESVVGDHRDCALNHRLDEKSIDLDEAGRKYDRAYIDLASAVMAEGRLPAGVEFVEAHSCVFKHRRFGHVILRYRDQLVSVLVTTIDSGSTELKFPPVQSDGFQLTHFETTQHAVYVVSSLSETENLSIAQAIEPLVSRHIRDAERVA